MNSMLADSRADWIDWSVISLQEGTPFSDSMYLSVRTETLQFSARISNVHLIA